MLTAAATEVPNAIPLIFANLNNTYMSAELAHAYGPDPR
jgi:hypothetical protein